jgi:hypothetical protein
VGERANSQNVLKKLCYLTKTLSVSYWHGALFSFSIKIFKVAKSLLAMTATLIYTLVLAAIYIIRKAFNLIEQQ